MMYDKDDEDDDNDDDDDKRRRMVMYDEDDDSNFSQVLASCSWREMVEVSEPDIAVGLGDLQLRGEGDGPMAALVHFRCCL